MPKILRKSTYQQLMVDSLPVRTARDEGATLEEVEALVLKTAAPERRTKVAEAWRSLSPVAKLELMHRLLPDDTEVKMALQLERERALSLGTLERRLRDLSQVAAITGRLMLTDVPPSVRIEIDFFDTDQVNSSEGAVQAARDDEKPPRTLVLGHVKDAHYAVVSDSVANSKYDPEPVFDFEETVMLGMPAAAEEDMVPAIIAEGQLGYSGELSGHGVISLNKRGDGDGTLYVGCVTLGNQVCFLDAS